jgi:hypothetical protein
MVCNKIIYISMWDRWDRFPSLGIYLHALYTNEEKSDPAWMFFVCTVHTAQTVHYKKRLSFFPSPARMSQSKLSLDGNY